MTVTRIGASAKAALLAWASLMATPAPALAAEAPPMPARGAPAQPAAKPAQMAIPAANPVRTAEAEKDEASQSAPQSGFNGGPEAAIAAALRGLLDDKAREMLGGPAAQSMDKTRRDAEREVLADEHAALSRFYAARKDAPIWVGPDGKTGKAEALLAAIADGAAYGLDPELIPRPATIPLPQRADADQSIKISDGTSANRPGPPELATIELTLSRAALVYARYARGGRILKPAEMLNSNLDRKPQLLSPIIVLAELSETNDVASTLAKFHPVHPQFEKLRQAFLQETDGDGKGRLSTKAKRLRANMEFWRWMWDDLGELYVFNNIPEFMQTVVRGGEVVRREKIVVGEIGKQSSVFSRPLKEVVLRPRWRVPESIMVHELWPSLRRGGGLMRQHGLEISTKSGQPRDWRQIDWTKDDIRNYHVWQPPGRGSALGFVKFSFPSQHTIFMHDTPDKWMFNRGQRTLSHGCLRLKNPMELTEIVLQHDRGWDRAKIKQLIKSGPLDNNVEIKRHIPIHLAYFTAWVDDDGEVRFFRDIYGHEKRVRQALDGDWKLINKGRNHLAKPIPRFGRDAVASAGTTSATPRKGKQPSSSVADLISEAFGF
jgi:murein L,D-transpeptidase YcbB/YkuD